MNILLIGPPGVGKGTQGKLLATKGFFHFSTGDIFREIQQYNTRLGRLVLSYMTTIHFIPDEISLEVVEEKLSTIKQDNIVFDGFPRSISQAQALDAMLSKTNSKVDLVFAFSLSIEEILKRARGRRLDPETGKIYHLETNPPPPEVTHLVQRRDDQDEIVSKRVADYHEKTVPVIQFYQERNIVHFIDASKSPEEIFTEILEHIHSL